MIRRYIPFFLFLVCLLALAFPLSAQAKAVEYDLTIAEEMMNFTGKPVMAMTINGGIPGPTIEMAEGDTVTIRVHNKMDVDTSIHWHGILLPNREDGVSYLTTPPIMPHSTHTFSFTVIQSGTYWYHSHTRLQEQRGVYGSIVIHPKDAENEHYPTQSSLEFYEQQKNARQSPGQHSFHASDKTSDNEHSQHSHHPKSDLPKIDREAVAVLSDWTNEDPHQVLRNLKRGLEWYGVKKGTKQSVVGAFKRKAVWASLKRSFSRMPPMDLSDVAYDAFLINGKKSSIAEAKPGETVRLRVINASASTYFYINYAGEMTIIAADGLRVKPVKENRILIAIAETYDVLVKVPDSGMAEFRATSQDGTGMASYWLGDGNKIAAPDIPKPNMYIMAHDMHAMGDGMKHGGHDMSKMTHSKPDEKQDPQPPETNPHAGHSMPGMDMGDMDMEPVTLEPEERPFAPYHELQAIEPTTLPDGRPLKEYTFHLTGDMTRYIWTINGKTLAESDSIRIRRGENVRFTLINDTMMHHPMHIHGHFFRVVNEQGDYSPLKHTVDVPPMGTRVIEFAAEEEKDWFFHCHVLYHMKSGMHQIISYEDSEPDNDIKEIRHMLFHDNYYYWGQVTPLSQMMEGQLNASNTRNTFRAVWEYDWQTEFDTELTYERYFNRFLQVFAGSNLYREKGDAFKAKGIAGIRYLLPFMVNSTVWVDSDGDFRVSGEKEISITRRLSVFGEIEYDTASQFEWLAGARYMLSKTFSLYGQYHSDFGAGGGLQMRF